MCTYTLMKLPGKWGTVSRAVIVGDGDLTFWIIGDGDFGSLIHGDGDW